MKTNHLINCDFNLKIFRFKVIKGTHYIRIKLTKKKQRQKNRNKLQKNFNLDFSIGSSVALRYLHLLASGLQPDDAGTVRSGSAQPPGVGDRSESRQKYFSAAFIAEIRCHPWYI